MSYSFAEAKADRMHDIREAHKGVDAPEKLRKLANIIIGEGNEPLADSLYRKANQIEMAYDEARDNEL